MSLLNKLWDDTIAGPPPDKGLGKLRKQTNLSFRSLNSEKPESEAVGNTAAEYPAMKVTRSITIVKPDRSLSETPPASPASPAGSTTPVSPFADECQMEKSSVLTSEGGGGGDVDSGMIDNYWRETFRFRRKSALDAFEKASGIGSRSPRPPYEL